MEIKFNIPGDYERIFREYELKNGPNSASDLCRALAVDYASEKITEENRRIEQLARKSKGTPKLPVFCGNCRHCKPGCYTTKRCIECKADARFGVGKTGYSPKRSAGTVAKNYHTGERAAKFSPPSHRSAVS